jgi:hypothetical protein
MLNLQSPLATKYRNKDPHELSTTPEENFFNDVVAAPHCALNHSQGSDRTGCQLQRLPSIKELDSLQRLRREEIERRNAELQSMSVMNKLMNNGGKIQPFPFMNRMESAFVQRNKSSMNFQDFDSDLLELMDDLGSDEESVTLDFHTINAKPRAPAPRLDIRPHRNFLAFKEEPVVILPVQSEDKFVDLFPSPHSNKFVLQFPNAPTQELTLNDSLDLIEGEKKLEDSTFDFNPSQECTHDKEQNAKTSELRSGVRACNENLGAQVFRPVDSNTQLPLSDYLASSSTSSSTGSSPMPTYLYHDRNHKVSLQPKKRRSHSTIEINGGHSPRSSSCSSFDDEENNTSNARPIPALPRSMVDDYAMDQITRDMRLQDISLDRLDNISSLSNRESDNSGAFLSLRPKRSRKPSLVLRAPYKDDHGDELMELNPYFSMPRDFEKSVENGMTLNSSYDYDQGLTLHHHRCPSVSFLDENEYSNRSRTFSSNSLQGIIEIAKEPSSKFMGMARQPSLGSLMSPSDLSESNFRTPQRYSFSLGNNQSQLNGNHSNSYSHLDEDNKKNSDLLLPKLFSSASHDSGSFCTDSNR